MFVEELEVFLSFVFADLWWFKLSPSCRGVQVYPRML